MTERVIVIQNNKFEIEFQSTDPQVPDSDDVQSVEYVHELSPYTMLLSSLGSCTTIVLNTYAQNHDVDLQEVELHLRYQRDSREAEEESSRTGGYEEKIEEELILRGDLNEQDRQKLFRVAGQCSIHKMMETGIEINSQLFNHGGKK